MFACHMFARIFEDEEKLEENIEKGVTKELIGAMSDQQSLVRIAATGALRNITSLPHCHKLCDRLLKEEIFAPMLTYIERVWKTPSQ